MRRILISVAIIFLFLVTACSIKTEEQQPDIVQLPLTDSDLSMLVRDFTHLGMPIGEIQPENNGYGFPIELVNELRYRMYQGDADLCINYLDTLSGKEFLITQEDFFSMVDMNHEQTDYILDEHEKKYVCYRIDIDGDGTDELIAFEKDGRGSYSYIYMLIKEDDGYIFYNSKSIENVRLFSLFFYDNEFYYAASCIDKYTGTVNLQLFMLNRNIFQHYNIIDSMCFNRKFEISKPNRLYINKECPDIQSIQNYLDEVAYDVVYANRAKKTFYGNEWNFRNDETVRRRAADRDLEIWNMYFMDINNDGKKELFSKISLEYEQPFIHSIIWYDENFDQCPAPIAIWNDNQYSLADMWFWDFNGKTITFSLYKETKSETQYFIDARIHENDKTTILLDYMVVLEPIDVFVTEFGVSTDIFQYRMLVYQDPALSSAFPGNLSDLAYLLLLKTQGPSINVKNDCEDVSDDFAEIISELLTDKALDKLDIGLGMAPYQINKSTFYETYGNYIINDDNMLNSGYQFVYQISLNNIDYFLLLEYSASERIEALHVYCKNADRLTYESTYYPEYQGGKVIEHDGKLYIAERPFMWFENPRYLDRVTIHQLIPERVQEYAVVDVTPETYQWQKIYDNHAPYNKAISDYLEEIKTELMDSSCLFDEETVYSGDENELIDADKLMRLKSIAPQGRSYYKIDFNNDQKDEYILKDKNHANIRSGIYQFTDKGITRLEYDDTVRDSQDSLKQLWFKEIDDKVFTVRLFFSEDYYYILNVSLIEGTDITQVQTHIFVPKLNYVTSKPDV